MASALIYSIKYFHPLFFHIFLYKNICNPLINYSDIDATVVEQFHQSTPDNQQFQLDDQHMLPYLLTLTNSS